MQCAGCAAFQRVVVLQIKQLQGEMGGHHMPYELQVPGMSDPVTLQRLVCFTGSRFVNRKSLEEAAGANVEPCRKRARTSSDVAGMPLLAALLNGSAPMQLSVSDAVALVAAATFANAAHVLAVLPQYYDSLFASAPIAEVRDATPISLIDQRPQTVEQLHTRKVQAQLT